VRITRFGVDERGDPLIHENLGSFGHPDQIQSPAGQINSTQFVM
jgi:hypothetical protein